ncbi:DNA-3-methyladenine glycosylase [Candidatus Pacearchaeota archaeon]|nr:DNA-3-methyladenine glycosylase [Candidatus Pacearchaeota archaeon]
MKSLPKSFFKKDTVAVAKALLGKLLVRETPKGRIIAKIVETEAYLFDDPASHSFRGETPRNAPMFNVPGRSYVYFTYGMYNCLNVTTNKKGIGEAVLIRALEPVEGIRIMEKNRGNVEEKNLCNGPGKLTMALGITREQNDIDLLDRRSELKLVGSGEKENFEIVEATRIGISKAVEIPHRFYVLGNKWVSQK